MADAKGKKKVGQETGQVRSPLPLDKLVPYLENNVKDFQGPLEVKQFKVSLRRVSSDIEVNLSLVWPIEPNVSARDPIQILCPSPGTFW